ncbi:protein ovarian tumor locus [Drosophila teissieri]|uniref:protein ovarian tumor locus n=1 Tax=Drosophila teissieri TaxID=7243 RepID=UPI001CBA395D|nr:protein ovarian tumor locus [Drosophila teissieri]
MMSETLQRSVSIGSKKASDPIDQFLEHHCLFRKHILMDASCLFRVIAEQVYDTQMLHYEVRMECVRFMFGRSRGFRRFVGGDFDEYLWRLGKTKTAGTMLELGALCHLYRRNVIIYEPFNLGRLVTYSKEYQENLRIFVNRQGHFDSVLTMQDVDMAAVCQAVAFKMLYKHLFRIPDVNLAVEWMLHPETFKCGMDFEFDARGNVIRLLCRNGRSFKLDRPKGTLCLLENYKLCPFHNPRLALDRQSRDMSCMLVLLQQNKHPFCYVAAKSMDPYMFRNVELTSLIESRREAKQWDIYNGDYNFKVGAKCQVELDTNRRDLLSTCYIQSINRNKSACQVFIEEQGKLVNVPYDNLHPLPPDEFKSWDLARKRRPKQPRLPHMSRMKRQFFRWRNTSRPQSRRSSPRQYFKTREHSSETRLQNASNKPSPPNQSVQEFGTDQKPATAPPINQLPMPPPMAIPRPVFLPSPPRLFGPPSWMPPIRPLMPNHLMIRPPGPLVFVQPPHVGPPPGMMPIPFLVHNSPSVFDTGYAPHPPAT